MAGAQSYRDLLIWQKGMDLCADCYAFTRDLPKEELYGLVAQMRRASVSVPSNIAEGFARESSGTFARIAQGSLKELETQLMICERVGMARSDQIAPLLSMTDEERRMIRAFARSLND